MKPSQPPDGASPTHLRAQADARGAASSVNLPNAGAGQPHQRSISPGGASNISQQLLVHDDEPTIHSERSPSVHFTNKLTLRFVDAESEASFQRETFLSSAPFQILIMAIFISLRIVYLVEAEIFGLGVFTTLFLGIWQIVQCLLYALVSVAGIRYLRRSRRQASSVILFRSTSSPRTTSASSPTATPPVRVPAAAAGAALSPARSVGSVVQPVAVAVDLESGPQHTSQQQQSHCEPLTLQPAQSIPADSGQAAAVTTAAASAAYDGATSNSQLRTDSAQTVYDDSAASASGSRGGSISRSTPVSGHTRSSASPGAAATAQLTTGSPSASSEGAAYHQPPYHKSRASRYMDAFVRSGAWAWAFCYVCIFQATVPIITDWLSCNRSFAEGRPPEETPGNCNVFRYNLFPLPPSLAALIAAASVAGVPSNVLPALPTILLCFVPVTAEYASFVTVTSAPGTALDVIRIAIQICALIAIICTVAYVRISSQRRAFALLISVEEQFRDYEAAVNRWTAVQHLLVEERERVAKATTAEAVGETTLGYLSHQLRNPLHFLSLTVADLEEKPPVTELGEVKEDLADISKAAVTMNKVLEDVAAHTSLLRGDVQPVVEAVDIRALIRNLAREFEAEKRRNIAVLAADDIPRLLRLDAVRVAQAVANGIANAVSATPSDGRISVHLKKVLGWRLDAIELSPAVLYADVSHFVVTDPQKAFLRSTHPGMQHHREAVSSSQVTVMGPGVSDPPLSPASLQALSVRSVSPRSTAVPSKRKHHQYQSRGRGNGGSTPHIVGGSGAATPTSFLQEREGAAAPIITAAATPSAGKGVNDIEILELEEEGGGAEDLTWFLHIEVRNEGPGLRNLSVPALFNPFGTVGPVTSTSIRATGLGLPITRLLAILLRGRVGLFDVYRVGTMRSSGGRSRSYAYTAFIFQVPYVEEVSTAEEVEGEEGEDSEGEEEGHNQSAHVASAAPAATLDTFPPSALPLTFTQFQRFGREPP